MLQAHLGSVWIGPKVTERIKEAIGSDRRSIFSRLTRDKVLKRATVNEHLRKNILILENKMVVYGWNTISGLLLCRSNIGHEFDSADQNIFFTLFVYSFALCWTIDVR